jgi:hypothetical protein
MGANIESITSMSEGIVVDSRIAYRFQEGGNDVDYIGLLEEIF